MTLYFYLLISFYSMNTNFESGWIFKNTNSPFIRGIDSQYSFFFNDNLVANFAIKDWLHLDLSLLFSSQKGNFDSVFDCRFIIKEGFFEIYHQIFSLSLGKKITRYGVGFLKNPSNIFDKKNAQDPEDKRNINEGDWIGELKVVPSAEFSTSFITSKEFDRNLLSIKTLLLNSDIDFVFFRAKEEKGIGFNFSRVLGDFEFHNETAYYEGHLFYIPSHSIVQEISDGFINISGISYGLGSSFSVIFEYLYNGFGFNKKEWDDFCVLLEKGDSISIRLYKPPFLRQHYTFTMLKFDSFLTPTIYYLQNWDDFSAYLRTSFEYNISAFTIVLELFTFVHNRNDEFSKVPFWGGLNGRINWRI